MAATQNGVRLWTYRRIPYVFEDRYPFADETRAAMTQWELAAGVFFIERSNEQNYRFVRKPTDGSGSRSYIGMTGGKQDIFINNGYKSLHELGHALGLIHEQCRSDRDQTITVNWVNIEKGRSNTDFQVSAQSNNLTAYDLSSVMHYPAPATGWGGFPDDQEVWTMTLNADHSTELGAGKNQGWDNLSDLDKSMTGLRRAYAEVPQGGWGPYPLDTSMGAITVDGDRPYIFVKGNDGSLWCHYWVNGSWRWDSHGTPAGVTIAESYGAITVDGGRPYVFVKGGDGQLWCQCWINDTWSWNCHGTPPGVTLEASYGAMTVDGGRPYVFVKGSDGQLWCQCWINDTWFWNCHGIPAGVTLTRSMGALAVGGDRPYVFVKGNDGNLWCQSWSGSKWSWDSYGAPIAAAQMAESIGAVNKNGDNPYVFVKLSDGSLWADESVGPFRMWIPINAGAAVAQGIGAITLNDGRPYVFYTDGSAQLWVSFWADNQWAVQNLGEPYTGDSIVGGMGATNSAGLPYAFIKDSEGDLWMNWWTPENNWGWQLQ